MLFAVMILHSSFAIADPMHRMVLALSLTPLIRILSLSMPLTPLPTIYWYPLTYVPLLLATIVVIRVLNYNRFDVGLAIGIRSLPFQLLIGSTGLILGIAEYLILGYSPVIPRLAVAEASLWSFVLLITTGFVEELIFRGVLQKSVDGVLGEWGIPYISLIFAIAHILHHSLLDLLFVFSIALLFGWIVKRTKSLLGVTIAHAITNILLFVIAPFIL